METLLFFFLAGQVFIHPVIPDITLTPAEFIDIIADFSIYYDPSPVFCSEYFGLTDPKTRTMSICANLDLTMRRWTLFHEAYHVAYARRGILTNAEEYEPLINRKAWELVQTIYGTPQTPVQAPETPKVP